MICHETILSGVCFAGDFARNTYLSQFGSLSQHPQAYRFHTRPNLRHNYNSVELSFAATNLEF